MHRILKPTGSIYLHCDSTVGHYIKMCMDAIFGKQNFRNEIVWRKYSGRKNNATRKFSTQADSIFFYVKSKDSFFQPIYVPISEKEIEKEYRHRDKNGRVFRYSRGRHYQQTGEQRRIYLDEQPGSAIGSLWVEDGLQLNTSSNERTGSPDQKPVSLYERIIQASSKEGDLVLDPFCGCATTIVAANNLKRRWIGIDRREDARYHIVTRLLKLSRKDREHLKKYAINEEWLDKQIQSCEMHYQSAPPTRTDNGEENAPELKPVYSAEPENLLSHDEMKKILITEFGAECWGCGFEPPDKDDRYLHLDHINPKSSGGSNDIDNRSILCQPCNSKKLNTMTLDGLRGKNKRENYLKKTETQLIDISSAMQWTRDYSVNLIRETPYQRELFRE